MDRSQGVLIQAAQFLKTAPGELLERMEQQANEMKELRQALEKFKAEASLGEARQFLASAKDVKGLHVLTTTRNGMDAAALRTMGDFLRDKDPKRRGGASPASTARRSPSWPCAARRPWPGASRPVIWCRHVSAVCGGKGGGKPDTAMGGGTDLLKVDDALATVDDFVSAKTASRP